MIRLTLWDSQENQDSHDSDNRHFCSEAEVREAVYRDF